MNSFLFGFLNLINVLKINYLQLMRRGCRHHLAAVVLLIATFPPLAYNQNIGGINQNIGGTPQNPTINQVSPGQIFSGTGNNPFYGGK